MDIKSEGMIKKYYPWVMVFARTIPKGKQVEYINFMLVYSYS